MLNDTCTVRNKGSRTDAGSHNRINKLPGNPDMNPHHIHDCRYEHKSIYIYDIYTYLYANQIANDKNVKKTRYDPLNCNTVRYVNIIPFTRVALLISTFQGIDYHHMWKNRQLSWYSKILKWQYTKFSHEWRTSEEGTCMQFSWFNS